MRWKHLVVAAGVFALNMKLAHVPNREIAAERCDGAPACTLFVAESLSIQCSDTSMQASATAVALLYVTDSMHSRHEVLHVADMRASVDSYLGDLEARSHSSEAECDEAAREERARFSETMRRFAQQSMQRRH
jgi:hypothetical protein